MRSYLAASLHDVTFSVVPEFVARNRPVEVSNSRLSWVVRSSTMSYVLCRSGPVENLVTSRTAKDLSKIHVHQQLLPKIQIILHAFESINLLQERCSMQLQEKFGQQYWGKANKPHCHLSPALNSVRNGKILLLTTLCYELIRRISWPVLRLSLRSRRMIIDLPSWEDCVAECYTLYVLYARRFILEVCAN